MTCIIITVEKHLYDVCGNDLRGCAANYIRGNTEDVHFSMIL